MEEIGKERAPELLKQGSQSSIVERRRISFESNSDKRVSPPEMLKNKR
jgi:hypothetical protein